MCVCVCSLSYPACKSHLFCVVLCGHLWPVWLYRIFPPLSHKLHDYRIKFVQHEICLLIFILILSETFLIIKIIKLNTIKMCRSQWPCGLRRRSTAARLLRLWVRIPPGAWIFVCCGCCVLSGRGLCDGLITRPGESYRLWRVVVCDQEN